MRRFTLTALVLASSLTSTLALSNDKVLNLYSARHYQTDEAMYAKFTETTGIKINRVDADDAGIIARLDEDAPNAEWQRHWDVSFFDLVLAE